MSMLSAQCDELRALAGDRSTEFVAGPIRASVLRMAADNIWALRNKLNDAHDAADAARDENARLRELVVEMHDLIASCECLDHCRYFEFCEDGESPDECWFLSRMRELGMEVSG